MAPERNSTSNSSGKRTTVRKTPPKYVYLDKYNKNNMELLRDMSKMRKTIAKNCIKIDLLESKLIREVRINKAVFITILAVNAAIFIYSLISS